MGIRFQRLPLAGLLVVAGVARLVHGQEGAPVAEIRKAAEQVVKTFNAGKADELAEVFLPGGELIDEQGTVYHGQAEIKAILGAFFKKFPGAKLTLNIESVRPVGPVALEEGTRTMTAKGDGAQSKFRYLAVWAKTDKGWKIASFRDFADDTPATAHEYLAPLAWLVGEWINEGADGKVAITYRWSDDKNYLLGEFDFTPTGAARRKSSQRIGWDPAAGKIRSWLFDADGGFAEGIWTVVADGAVIKTASVNPDGSTATATMTVTPEGKDRYKIAGTDRIVGDAREVDFEITVARRPPAAGK